MGIWSKLLLCSHKKVIVYIQDVAKLLRNRYAKLICNIKNLLCILPDILIAVCTKILYCDLASFFVLYIFYKRILAVFKNALKQSCNILNVRPVLKIKIFYIRFKFEQRVAFVEKYLVSACHGLIIGIQNIDHGVLRKAFVDFSKHFCTAVSNRILICFPRSLRVLEGMNFFS